MGCVDNDADTFFRQDGMIKLKGRTNIAKEECDREEEATRVVTALEPMKLCLTTRGGSGGHEPGMACPHYLK